MSEKFFERRNQFPSKFSPVPGIGASSPQPTEDNALVPISAGGSMGQYGDNEDRMRMLETRVNVAEKSNRALLEEVVRLQSELKTTVKRNEDIIREERGSRQQIENSLRGATELISQMSTRLLHAEEKLTDEKNQVTALRNHTKSVEQAVLGSQQELLSRRELQQTKMQELRGELDETIRSKESMEKVLYTMLDDMRQLKARVDSQASDFTTIALDLKNKSRKLEEETRNNRMDTLRKHGETQSQNEHTTTQLRGQVESRLAELRDVVVDLRNKQDAEIQERRVLEQQTQVKIADLQAANAEQSRKRDEALHALEIIQREKEHSAEHDRIKLQGKIAEIAEEVSKKILQKEIKLRQESQDKFSTLESMVLAEQVARQKFEQDLRNEQENRWEGLKQLTEDEMHGLRDSIKNDKKKHNDMFHRLNEAVNLIEKQIDIMKKESDKILGAEIKSRKQHQRDTVSKIDDVNEKLAVATSTLQQAIGGMKVKMEEEAKKVKRELKARMDDQKEADTRTMADIDARLTSLNRKLVKTEEDLEQKISETSVGAAAALREKVQSITLWQDVTQQTLRELQTQLRDLPREVSRLEDRHKALTLEINSRVKDESDERSRDVNNLKRDIERLEDKQGSNQSGQQDIEACQQSIRKLAESIQTVKTVLGMKIQSEQKVTEETVEDIKEDIYEIQHQIGPLIGKPNEPKVFIKPDEWERTSNEVVEGKAEQLTKWNLYNTYRWLNIKAKWMFPVWKSKARNHINNSLDNLKNSNELDSDASVSLVSNSNQQTVKKDQSSAILSEKIRSPTSPKSPETALPYESQAVQEDDESVDSEITPSKQSVANKFKKSLNKLKIVKSGSSSVHNKK